MSGAERSVRGAGRRYLEDATVGGVRRATRPGVVIKALWMAAIVTGAAMTAFSIHELVSARAARRELRSVTRMDDRRNQEFPAVTICNVNPFVSFNAPILTPQRENQELSAAAWKAVPTAASRFKRQATENEMLDETFASRLANHARLDNLTLEELEAMGHPIHIFVPECRLGDYTCDTRNFTHFYDDSLGNCYTFVAQPPKHHTWKTGPENGLTLYLSTNTQRRSQTDPEEIGVVVKVHAPHDTIFVAEEGVYVPLDSAAYVAITKAEDNATSNSDCVDTEQTDSGDTKHSSIFAVDGQWKYSQRACQRTCLQRSLVGLCGCCDVSLPCPAALLDVTSQSRVAAPRCNLTEESQAQCVQDVVSKYTEGDLSCLSDCKPRCRATKYRTRHSLTTWSGEVFTVHEPQDTTTSTMPPTTTTSTTSRTTTTSTTPRTTTTSTSTTATSTTPPSPSTDPFTPPSRPTGGPTEGPVAAARRKRGLSMTNGYPSEDMGISVLADVKIYVYFEDLRTRVTETVQAQPYEWVELMADIGGVASLWLGLSVLGVLEIVHMLVELSFVGFSKCCGKGDHSVTPVKPFDGSA